VGTEELLEAFRAMTLAELDEFRTAFEREFGVSARVPEQRAGTGPDGAPPAEPEDEQTEFSVRLESSGNAKIQVIKAVRALRPELGLKEAKDAVEALPFVVLPRASKAQAGHASDVLTAAGAVVSVG
jgi:large subunit ribosomal protein L7/L12